MMATNFFILDAADVAITEAAVGAGVSTVLFLSALALTGEKESGKRVYRLLPSVALFTLAVVLIIVSLEHPRLGDPSAPVHQHIAPWYLSETPVLIDIPNVVTAVLASFRGYDTLGETLVVFTAGIGVLSVLGFRPKRKAVVTVAQVSRRTVRIRDLWRTYAGVHQIQGILKTRPSWSRRFQLAPTRVYHLQHMYESFVV